MIPRRILVIDDNTHAAEALAVVLGIWGHEVRVAHDGPAGLEAGSELLPHVVLLDIEMPTMDGFEVARRLRDDPRFAGGLLIALSGHDPDELPGRGDASRFDHWLRKPFDFEALEALLAGTEPTRGPSGRADPARDAGQGRRPGGRPCP